LIIEKKARRNSFTFSQKRNVEYERRKTSGERRRELMLLLLLRGMVFQTLSQVGITKRWEEDGTKS